MKGSIPCVDKQARVCPLECDSGFKAQDNKCVKITCDSGSTLNDRGVCEPVKANTRETSRPEPEKRRAAEPRQQNQNAKQAAGGSQQRYVCDRFSCQEVKKGLLGQIVRRGSRTNRVMICPLDRDHFA